MSHRGVIQNQLGSDPKIRCNNLRLAIGRLERLVKSIAFSHGVHYGLLDGSGPKSLDL